MSGPAVAQVIAVDRGHHHVTQVHRAHGLGQMRRLVDVQRLGTPMRHIAKRAAAGAQGAHDHEGGGAVAEALAQIRAGRFFAYRV